MQLRPPVSGLRPPQLNVTQRADIPEEFRKVATQALHRYQRNAAVEYVTS